MLRATSETAVARMVRSVPENVNRAASSRAARLAATTSESVETGIWTVSWRCALEPASGTLSRPHRSHSNTWRPRVDGLLPSTVTA